MNNQVSNIMIQQDNHPHNLQSMNLTQGRRLRNQLVERSQILAQNTSYSVEVSPSYKRIYPMAVASSDQLNHSIENDKNGALKILAADNLRKIPPQQIRQVFQPGDDLQFNVPQSLNVSPTLKLLRNTQYSPSEHKISPQQFHYQKYQSLKKIIDLRGEGGDTSITKDSGMRKPLPPFVSHNLQMQ